jgi:hypothetical protein
VDPAWINVILITAMLVGNDLFDDGRSSSAASFTGFGRRLLSCAQRAVNIFLWWTLLGWRSFGADGAGALLCCGAVYGSV